MKVLIAGWFSFPDMGATAGDLMARDLAHQWLMNAGVDVDLAVTYPFRGGVDWEVVDPAAYTHLVFVCGPIGNGPPVDAMLARFSGCSLLGLDLTMLESLETWNPFDLLLERDSDRAARPDLAIAAAVATVPVVGLVLIHPQPEYGCRDWHQRANATIEAVTEARPCARLRIDTRLDLTESGLRSPAEVTALFRVVDVVLTTRLHGLVLALRAGVPVVALDPVEGGAKVTRQARTLGWPWCFPGDVPQSTLAQALEACLHPDAREVAKTTREDAVRQVEATREAFLQGVLALSIPERR